MKRTGALQEEEHRVECPYCQKHVALTPTGKVWKHKDQAYSKVFGSTICPGSRLRVERQNN